MDLDDLMRNWRLGLDNSEEQRDDPPEDILDDGEDNFDEADHDLPELPAYKEFICKAPAYEWLLQSIRKELLLNVAEANVRANIRQTILDCLPKTHRVSRKESPNIHTATFTVEWDPCSFLQEQEYSESPEEVVERAIAITGSHKDAQATTIVQYLSQTWPTTGIHLLSLTKEVVQGVPNRAYFCTQPKECGICSLGSNIPFTFRQITR
jgi:hypothetical protein